MTTGTLPTTAQDAATLGYRVKQLFVRNAVAKDVEALPTDLATQIGHALSDAALRLTFTVSTDTVDLAGDAMARSALDQMATQAIGTLFFMNHSWGVPEDVLGVVEAARVVQRALVVPETGETVAAWCLDFTVRVAGSNPRAMQIYNLVTLDHMPVDASVTIIITDDKNANGINTINDVVYLECSAVGIGMNTLATVFSDGQKSIAPHQIKDKTAMGKPATPAVDAPKSKGLWEQSKAEQAALSWETSYDLWTAFLDGSHDLIELCEEGKCENPDQMLKDLINGFAGDLYTLISPALQPIVDTPSTPTSLSAARALVAKRSKSGAKHSTDTLDHLNGIHDAHHASLDHMNALGVGCSKCMKEANGMDTTEESASKAFRTELATLHTKIAGLESEKARLSTELAAKTATIDQLTAEKADAERTAEVAVAMLEHIEQQPMPLGQS